MTSIKSSLTPRRVTISAQDFGDARQVAANDTAHGRARNRRVEIVIAAAGPDGRAVQ